MHSQPEARRTSRTSAGDLDHISYDRRGSSSTASHPLTDRQSAQGTPLTSLTLEVPTELVPAATAAVQYLIETVGASLPAEIARVAGTERVRVAFDVYAAHGPALRSAVEQLKNQIGTSLEAPSSYAREAALTNAAIGVGSLMAAVCAVVDRIDPDFEKR
jgi:hypothetical protein